jgi:hypothetical protein
MTTLGIMMDRIADELARADLTSQISDAIRSAINYYAGEHWFFNEVADFSFTTSSSLEIYPVPDDFERLVIMQTIIGGQRVPCDYQTYDTIRRWQTNLVFGQPTDFSIYNRDLVVYPIPNGPFVEVLSYIQTVSTLTSTACTNAFMTYGEELIRNRARADIQVNFLRDGAMTAEMQQMAASGLPFISHRERMAYQSLRARHVSRTVVGRARVIAW